MGALLRRGVNPSGVHASVVSTILTGMSIAISEDHKALAETVHDFLEKKGSKAAARALLDGAEETLPELWPEIANLGWLGLHIPEKLGGSGYGLEELVVVAEEMGRGLVPGP